jgi:acyl-CoA reductase-like NAD-dependent aldehyde dehydrogenase
MRNINLSKLTSNLKHFVERPFKERSSISKKNLKILRNILKKNKNKIIKTITQDVKKTLKDSEIEFNSSLDILNYVIKNFNCVKHSKKFFFKNGDKGVVNFEPIGVVAFITPWNYPLLTIFERLPFSLACGCSAVLKPSEFTPNFSKLLIKLFNSNLNLNKCLKVLPDLDRKTGLALCKDRNISLISFVGSTSTGKKIIKQCSTTLKKTNLELGGKNSAIICKTSNLDTAVSKVINGIFENGGQACVGISRVIIHEHIFDTFVNKILIEVKKLYRLRKLKIQIPVVQNQKKKILSSIKYIKLNYPKNLIKVLNMGSKKFTPIFVECENKKDFFIKNEFFFPIVIFEKFQNLNECINLVNDAGYGLASYIFSSSKFEVKRLTTSLQSGRIWVNSSLRWSPTLPVGGYNLSGNGRDMGQFGFNTYLTTKSLYLEK